jgi:hypothetical protein
MTVRVAKSEDFDEVWRLFLFAYEENAILPLSERKASWHIRRALEPEKIDPSDTGVRGVIGVIGEPDSLEAAVFLNTSTSRNTFCLSTHGTASPTTPKH